MITDRPKYVCAALLTLVFVCLQVMPAAASAAIKEVTLFPDSARVEASIATPPANPRQAIILLPPQADPESLLVAPPSGGRLRIDDIRITSVTRLDEEKIARLRAKLKTARNEKKDLQARFNALDAQLLFWQAQTKAKTKTVAEADQLASAIGRSSRKIFSEKNVIEADLEKVDNEIKELQDQLNEAAGRAEKAWQAVVTLSGAASGDTLLTYSYILAGCGWHSLYRLEALPAKNSVVFSWDAEVWQSTGEDWTQVQVHLATLKPVRTIAPGDLPQWIIKPREATVYPSSRKAKSAPAMMEQANTADDAFAHTTSAPVETTLATYASWSLGKKTIPAGGRQHFKISEETWPARFLFLARPSLSPQAFLQAAIKLAKPAELPDGQASFMIDGALIGKRRFSLAGSEADIFFGVSPLVSVRSFILADQSDTTRILQNRQTRNWLWRIEAQNNGGAPVRLRIEEPMPQSRDERIRLAFRLQPEPAEKDTTKWVWIMDVPARQTQSIETGVELSAPADMIIDFGWRH